MTLWNFYPSLPITDLFPTKIFSCRLFLAETCYRFGDFEQTFLAFERVKALQPEGPAAQQVARTCGLGDSEAPGEEQMPCRPQLEALLRLLRIWM